jgi:hypothetical protein
MHERVRRTFVLIVIILFSYENIIFVPMEMKTFLSSI